MLFGKYQFFCEFETNAVLPPFKGSTFRGIFGRALKKVICVLKHQECTECLLSSKSVYVQIFELSDDFNRKYFDPYIKHLKLPLSATFEYLKEMGHEAGERFFKNKKEIENIQSNLNYSILAHGINPVTEKAAQSIFSTVSDFVQETDFFDFPKLP
jgi:hypothetical protein